MFDLSKRIAIITGGAGFLGQEHANILAEAGATIAIVDIQEDLASVVAKNISQRFGVRAESFPTDITDKSAVQSMVRKVLDKFGTVDILVNNAAIDSKFSHTFSNDDKAPFETYSLEHWNLTLQVNLTGMFLCTQAVSEPMLKQARGVVVNVSSIYGLVGPDQRMYRDPNSPTQSYKSISYSTTKSAVHGFTRHLAAYWGKNNIRVNSLTLGGVFNDHQDGFVERYSSRTPLGKMADKSDFQGALLFLSSDASSYMTGSNLVVDGGWTAW